MELFLHSPILLKVIFFFDKCEHCGTDWNVVTFHFHLLLPSSGFISFSARIQLFLCLSVFTFIILSSSFPSSFLIILCLYLFNDVSIPRVPYRNELLSRKLYCFCLTLADKNNKVYIYILCICWYYIRKRYMCIYFSVCACIYKVVQI